MKTSNLLRVVRRGWPQMVAICVGIAGIIATAVVGHMLVAPVLVLGLVLIFVVDVFVDRDRLPGGWWSEYRNRTPRPARWTTVIDGTEKLHATREDADAWAAAHLAKLPEGTHALIDRWVTDDSTGVDLNGQPGVWQYEATVQLERGQLIEVAD